MVKYFDGFDFMGPIIIVRAASSGRCVCFSPGVCRDLRACRGIWKKCCPVYGTLDSRGLSRESGAVGGVIWGKPGIEVIP
jgi:hypothetical protein